MSTSEDSPGGVVGGKVVILHKAKALPDADLALSLESGLKRSGVEVFLDRRTSAGLSWAKELEGGVEGADLVVVLVSEGSAQSELLGYELEVVSQVAERMGGRPVIVPVRVFYRGPLGEGLAGILRPLEFEWSADTERHVSRMVIWQSAADDGRVLELLKQRLGEARAGMVNESDDGLGGVNVPRVPDLESVGGAVPLDSKFYVERGTDGIFSEAVDRRDSLVLVKGARQMGKTSLLARGLDRARGASCRVVLTDFQRLQSADFESLTSFYRALTEVIAGQLGVEEPEERRWSRNPNGVFEGFWISALRQLGEPVLWAIDEFDRLFTSSFGAEVCGLLRSWHNARALDPSMPWRYLTVAMAYATEAQLFISDLNQSPFNVGTRLSLSDFSLEEVGELNRRYGEPLKGQGEVQRFHELLGGHPYLTRSALNEMVRCSRGMDLVEELAGQEDSIFGEHLRRLLYGVGRDPVVTEALRALLFREEPPVQDVFYRMRSAGVVVGAGAAEARMRCLLYRDYLCRHLAGAEG